METFPDFRHNNYYWTFDSMLVKITLLQYLLNIAEVLENVIQLPVFCR